MRRHLVAVLALGAAVALAGCGQQHADGRGRPAPPARTSAHASASASAPQNRPSGSASPSRSSAPAGTATATPSVDFGIDPAQVGAMDTILVYCAPGLPGSPRQGCDLGRIRSGVTEAVAPAARTVAAHPGDPRYSGARGPTAGVTRAVAELKPCAAWYRQTEQRPECAGAWFDLTLAWRAFTTAVHWP